ncbi:MAG: J domain-containing protein [Candidatus Limnocylindria bacterium]
MPTTRRAPDPYAILGVSRDATPLQVARAHRNLAKRHHPDLHEGATDAAERMRRINEAWSILSNPIQRAEYDRAHPLNGMLTPGGHWVGSRAAIRTSPPSSTRTWATWRTTAAETRAAPRTQRQPGEVPTIRTRRPPRPEPAEPVFRDSGWAALIAAGAIIVLLAFAIVAGRAF